MATVSTFAERFLFARDRSRPKGLWMDDGELAKHLGFKSQSEISTHKKRKDPPHAGRVLVIAQLCQVDPGWLAFGHDSQAPEPDEFPTWVEGRRRKLNAPLEQRDIPAPRGGAGDAEDKSA